MCMSNVVGSNAHRTTLRHVNRSYTNLFGAPLVFTTANIADSRSPVLNLIYMGATVTSWRLLEENAPPMPSAAEMRRRVAKDPVSQAIVFDLMMHLFLEHVLGVSRSTFRDGIAASGAFGAFGPVQAFFGPIETQGRGGLHAHMHVWVLGAVSSAFLANLRAGVEIPGLHQKLTR